MKKKIFIIIISVILIILGFVQYKIIVKEKGNYNVKESFYSEGKIEVSYPQITGIKDIELQSKINKLLKNEAFREYQDAEDFFLEIYYEISYRSDRFLSVIYRGSAYNKKAAYPRDLFTSINIDMYTGNRIQLADIVDVDDIFIEKVRKTLSLYADEINPGLEPVYSDKLNNDNEYFMWSFLNADADSNASGYSYFAEDYLGISFFTYHNLGDHFEIEIKYTDIKESIKMRVTE